MRSPAMAESSGPARSERLQELLAQNAAALRELRSTQVFVTPPEDTVTESAPLPEHPELAALREEASGLRNENIRLAKELEASHERAGTIAACQRRQSEIHTTLMRAAYDEAVEARNEARTEAASLRSQLAQLNTDLETLQKRLSVQQRSAEADMGLLRARTAAAQRELVGALDGERAMTAAGVHLGVLRAECVPRLHARACQRPHPARVH